MSSRPETPALLSRIATLGDFARVRILRLLERRELSVGELARALQLPQSTVSRHLKVLLEADWVAKRTEGTASLYRFADHGRDPDAHALWTLVHERLAGAPTLDEDDRRLDEVIAERRLDSRAFFGRVAGEWDALRRELFGDAFTSQALVALVPPEWTVADLGCGTGNAAELLAPLVRRVIAVDREPAMLDAARQRLARFDNVEFRTGDLLEPPLAAGEIDAALLVLVLQHVEEPVAVLRALRAALRRGGVILVVDLVPHDREAYRHTMGHRHLGFGEDGLRAAAAAAGLELARYRTIRPDVEAEGPGLFAALLRRDGSA